MQASPPLGKMFCPCPFLAFLDFNLLWLCLLEDLEPRGRLQCIFLGVTVTVTFIIVMYITNWWICVAMLSSIVGQTNRWYNSWGKNTIGIQDIYAHLGIHDFYNPTNVMSHQIQAVELRSRFYPDMSLSMDLTDMSNLYLLGRCSCVFFSLEKSRFFFTLGRSRYNRIIFAFWFVCMFMCAPEQPVSPGREREQKVRSNLGWSVQSIACSQTDFCPLRSPHVVGT